VHSPLLVAERISYWLHREAERGEINENKKYISTDLSPNDGNRSAKYNLGS
jgi:hypothetical protein